MIIEGKGDLLAADVEALVNTVNCVGVMGKGIALQFKRKYPENFKDYAAACKQGRVELGRMFVVDLHALTGPRSIVNFPTKGHWKAKSKLSDISKGLDDLLQVIRDRGIKSIAVPPLGAGNGGLDWREVEPLVRQKLSTLPDVEVHLFTPSNAARNLTPDPVKMTWGRSTLVELLRGYVARRLAVEPWEEQTGASHLEIQKLMYFAQLVEPTLRLRFEVGIYGPYSEQVRHLVQQMEAVFLEGFGDGTSPVQKLDPISPTVDGVKESHRFVNESVRGRNISIEIVEPVLQLIDGFEDAYSIELLASTHWVASHGHSSVVDVVKAIHDWTPRKRRLFTESDVEKARDHLIKVGLI